MSPYAFAVVGRLPDGVELDPATGFTKTDGADFPPTLVTLIVTDMEGKSGTYDVLLTVAVVASIGVTSVDGDGKMIIVGIAFTRPVEDFTIADVITDTGAVASFEQIDAQVYRVPMISENGKIALHISAGSAHDVHGVGNKPAMLMFDARDGMFANTTNITIVNTINVKVDNDLVIVVIVLAVLFGLSCLVIGFLAWKLKPQNRVHHYVEPQPQNGVQPSVQPPQPSVQAPQPSVQPPQPQRPVRVHPSRDATDLADSKVGVFAPAPLQEIVVENLEHQVELTEVVPFKEPEQEVELTEVVPFAEPEQEVKVSIHAPCDEIVVEDLEHEEKKTSQLTTTGKKPAAKSSKKKKSTKKTSTKKGNRPTGSAN